MKRKVLMAGEMGGLMKATLVAGVALVFGMAGMVSSAEAAISRLQNWALRWSDTTATFAYPSAGTLATFAIPASTNPVSTNRVLIVAIASNATGLSAQSLTNIRYGGQPLALAQGNASAVQPNHSYLYYLDEAGIQAATSQDLEVTITGGTAVATWIYTAVYDGVDAAPIGDSQTYSNAASNTAFGPFATPLTVNDGEQAIVICNVARSTTGTALRTLPWTATPNWTTAGVAVSNAAATPVNYTSQVYIRDRTVMTAGTEALSQTASNTAFDSMNALSIKPYVCSATAPADLAAPSVNYDSVDLTWTYDGTNNSSYNVYRGGVQIGTAATGSYTDNTVAQGTPYTYTVRGFNGICESGDSNAVPVTTGTYTTATTTGAITFSNVTADGMTVTVGYSADDNDSNTLTLKYGTTDGGPYPNTVTVSVDRPSRTWSGTISGLSPSTFYYFQATFSDGDTVSGANPVLASRKSGKQMLLHSSEATGTKYGTWGGTLTCGSCHQANASPNIKRIRSTVNASGQAYNGRALSTTDARGSETSGYASVGATNKVCDVCHTSTLIYKNATSMTTSGTPAMLVGANPPHPADLDCSKCHEHKKAFKASAGCVDCHGVGGVYQAGTAAFTIVDKSGAVLRGEAYGGHLKALKTDSLAGLTDSQWNAQCLKCHDGHVNTDGVHIPNNTAVGINYVRGYIALGGTATNGSTEAEICWNCHDLAGNGVSEWGTNTDTNGTASNYDWGSLNRSNWTGAMWSSAVAGFSFKTGNVLSTHTANPQALGGPTSTANHGQVNPDSVAQIRCSYCHDVHNTAALLATWNANLRAADPNGKPYLRGSWKGNPYLEDGPPREGLAGVAPSLNIYGAVPRGGVAHTELGGFQIDQNNGNPTAGWTASGASGFAGLCILCHEGTGGTAGDGIWQAGEINNLNQFGGASDDWVGTGNGHANSVLGGSGAGASDIFSLQDRHSVIPTFGTSQGQSPGNPAMAYRHKTTNNSEEYGFRNASARAGEGWDIRPLTTAIYAYNSGNYTWGATITATAGVIDTGYHKFSCSKCHNPHASRLPRLMVTNCLDTNHNTWDTATGVDMLPPTGTNNGNGQPIGVDNGGLPLSNATSAQNCHRVRDSNYSNSRGAGWNTVTPWKEF